RPYGARSHGNAAVLLTFRHKTAGTRDHHAAVVRGRGVSLFSWAARVYWEDTDGGGIVYYANYLRFLERARTEWLRSLGHSQLQLAQTEGILFAVAGLSVECRRPARWDGEWTITGGPRGDRATAMRFVQRIHRAP